MILPEKAHFPKLFAGLRVKKVLDLAKIFILRKFGVGQTIKLITLKFIAVKEQKQRDSTMHAAFT